MPVLNEERHLEAAIRRVLDQEYPGELEVIIAVGPSSDRTPEIAAALSAADSRIRVVDNPAARTPAALNLGIAAAHSQVRADDDHPPALLAPRRPRTVDAPFTVEGFQSVHSQAGASSPPSNNWIGAPGMMVEIACL